MEGEAEREGREGVALGVTLREWHSLKPCWPESRSFVVSLYVL